MRRRQTWGIRAAHKGVTTSLFPPAAERWAAEARIHLINGPELLRGPARLAHQADAHTTSAQDTDSGSTNTRQGGRLRTPTSGSAEQR